MVHYQQFIAYNKPVVRNNQIIFATQKLLGQIYLIFNLMKLYHGSPNSFDTIRKSQAQAGDGIKVPDDELLNAIYLTPNYEFALAIASMPKGATDIDEATRTIKFENPEAFDPEKEVYVYEIDSEAIPKENLKEVDELQIAVLNIPELKPSMKHIHKAGDVEKYYEIKREVKEVKNETKLSPEFKIK
ncbi:hypothetical protein A2531_00025 [Candidatus Falkowbacteria bacterium RIFOXYD2_FULL_34_120]|uniref:Uncharacterized protein n=1 Tax=Candidatus Falkowbacteria bacterium RIFOXYD2_FULL_34_120 TaxID=1798007 RepID=A0A1F5TRD9_9BACT|nr:MAG: hypothetical protein A2500_01620 [Candidatus Falkowbacteria bacterium RIFOXYC12_FULL_34_55]OGF37634.1 MAG: hypothetical protein A2466_01780 [Candidatus Falkowbacteria bacterium RIFOXYC2_FULL_34_220]OGF39281.1 MAG: hypothetical protein A2515_01860 [Candidatus Falkowbacteria bacterium RIFOXYD12_FULL_34_57]OGF41419.1 MAG: hypothetical protein A2531_00025 [Candidatus Falkowbacteria bacterium RIFOXYD2_FULL_34_120]